MQSVFFPEYIFLGNWVLEWAANLKPWTVELWWRLWDTAHLCPQLCLAQDGTLEIVVEWINLQLMQWFEEHREKWAALVSAPYHKPSHENLQLFPGSMDGRATPVIWFLASNWLWLSFLPEWGPCTNADLDLKGWTSYIFFKNLFDTKQRNSC